MRNTVKIDKTDISQVRLRCYCTEEEQCEPCALRMTVEYEWWMLQESFGSEIEALETRKALKERELLLDLLGGLIGASEVSNRYQEVEGQLYGF